jgi:hypothetical protein
MALKSSLRIVKSPCETRARRTRARECKHKWDLLSFSPGFNRVDAGPLKTHNRFNGFPHRAIPGRTAQQRSHTPPQNFSFGDAMKALPILLHPAEAVCE